MPRRAVFGLTSQFLSCLSCYLFGVLMAQSSAVAQNVAVAKAAATSFRVDTDIFFKEKSKEPDKQTLTLFKEGVYYDFAMDESRDVTVIDPLGGRIIMLSPMRQLKTTFETAKLSDNVQSVQQNVSNSSELTKILTAAQRVSEPEKNKLLVGDDTLAYEATMQTAKDESMAAQYADFADWSAKLNMYTLHFPPFLRLELNRQIASRGLLPDTVRRISKHETVVVKTKLIVVAGLSRDDEAKLQAVGRMLHQCREVSQEDFFSAKPVLTGQSTVPGAGVRK